MSKKITLHIFSISIGALAGFLYWYFIGCDAGCAIQSHWYTATPFGAAIGYLFVDLFKVKKNN